MPNPFDTKIIKEKNTMEDFVTNLNALKKIDRSIKRSKRKSINRTPLTYEISGKEDVDTKIIKEEFNNSEYILQDLSEALGDSPSHSAHSSLKNTNSISKKTRDLLALFLDKHVLSIMVSIDDAEALSSGKKALVMLDEENITSNMTPLEIHI